MMSQCTYRCVVLPDCVSCERKTSLLHGLNAPTGAWCSLTGVGAGGHAELAHVSMHLQVRGAP